jgi:hypothetical protein
MVPSTPSCDGDRLVTLLGVQQRELPALRGGQPVPALQRPLHRAKTRAQHRGDSPEAVPGGAQLGDVIGTERSRSVALTSHNTAQQTGVSSRIARIAAPAQTRTKGI